MTENIKKGLNNLKKEVKRLNDNEIDKLLRVADKLLIKVDKLLNDINELFDKYESNKSTEDEKKGKTFGDPFVILE